MNTDKSIQPVGLGNKLGVRTAAVIIATVVCMALAFHTVDVGAVGKALSGIKPRYAALAVVLLLCNALVAMARFRVVLGKFGYVPAWRPLFAAFAVGLVGNQFVLNIIAQSIGRAGVLASIGVPFGATIIATLLERLLAAGLLGAAGLVAGWYLLPHFGFDLAHGGAYFLSLVGGMVLASLAAAWAVYRPGTAARAVSAAARGVGRFWAVGMLTVLAHCFMLGSYIAVLLALGLAAATPEIASALVVVMFAAGLPISLSGWGIRELSAVAALGAVGMEPATALAAALLVGLFALVVTLAISCPGLFLLLAPGRGSRPVAAVAREGPSPDWNARLVTGCAALAAVTIFFQVRLQSGDGQITANVADLFALIGLGSLLLILVQSRERFAALPRPMIAALAALSLLLAYGLLLGYANFGASAWALLNRGLGWLVILGYVSLGLSVAFLDVERGRWLILRMFVAAGTSVAALQLVFLVVRKLGFPLPEEVLPYPMEGFAGNVNAFGLQMTMTAIVGIVAHRLGVLGQGRRWLIAILVLTGLVVYFTGSRSAIGMFAMTLVLSVVFASRVERYRALATSLVTTFGVVVAAVAISNIPALMHAPGIGEYLSRTDALAIDSDSERWQTITDGWHYWLERPIFGHGIGAYVEDQLADSGSYLVFHSVPIWLLAETGIVGLAVGLTAFGCLVLGARQLMRDSSGRAWGTGLLIALVCWGAGSLVHDFVFQRTFWFFVAFAFGVSSLARSGAGQRAAPRLSEEKG